MSKNPNQGTARSSDTMTADFEDDTLAELEAFLADDSGEKSAESAGDVDFDEMLKAALETATEAAPEIEEGDAWLNSLLDQTEVESAAAIEADYENGPELSEVLEDAAKAANKMGRAPKSPGRAGKAHRARTTDTDGRSLEDAVAAALRTGGRPPADGGAKRAKRVSSVTKPVDPASLLASTLAPQREQPRDSAKIEELREQVKRFSTETEQYRKRMEDQARQARSKGREDVFARLMPIIDTLEIALKAAPSAKSAAKVIAGVEIVFQQLLTELGRLGFESLDPMGENFAPALHEAMQKTSTGTVTSGQINMVIRRGFRFEKKLIRAAQVIVEV
jgi:molecular chaperone GrpE